MPAWVDKILRTGEGKLLKELKLLADQVSRIEADYTAMSDGELIGLTDVYRQRLADGETTDDLLPEAFATVREASMRTLHKRHYDVQIMGGAALHKGTIAEMRTGEGKTLVCTLPAYLNGLTGKGVHVVTVNDYLAQRDAEQMGRVHRFLGLTVGVLVPQQPSAARKAQYRADITYGTNSEFGFDYLRDNMAMSEQALTQRGHHFAVVDEVDSILIDEARTPLIISGPADQPTKWYGKFAALAKFMRRDVDYEVDEKKRTVGVLESGIELVEDELGIENLYEAANTPLIQYLNNALKAKELYLADRDYVLMDGEVNIVDEHTGRVLSGRRYSEGMHQAIEAKEGVEIKQENQTLATITLQNFFRLYETLSGMTGTAMTEASEFDKTYGLGVVQIPTNKPTIRQDLDDQIFKSGVTKYDAVVDDLAERHAKGQPVLVGTASVQSSEYLSGLLSKQGIRHEVLNAKQHDREAAIVARAGHKGAVTVATNMAGRGTDIMLGGNPEFLADEELQARGIDPAEHLEQYEQEWPAVLEKYERQVAAEHEEVLALGGLYVLGTERHESRRIDNQLRGRSGRQGDPGESKFYISLEDDLMRRFGGAVGLMERAMAMLPDDVPIESKSVTRSIQRAQAQAESQNFEIRKDVLKYDDVLNRQRQVIYGERRQVLRGEDIHEQTQHMLTDVVANYTRAATGEGYPESWDLEQLWRDLSAVVPITVTIEEIERDAGGRDGLTTDLLIDGLSANARESYAKREESVGSERMRELEREVVLSVLDRKWREHLYEMDYLREGIGLRAMAQRNPLVEYQREGYDMFVGMTEGIKEDAVRLIFAVEVAEPEPEAPDAIRVVEGLVKPRELKHLEYSAPTVDGAAGVEHRTVDSDGDEGESADEGAAEAKPKRGKRTRKSGSRKR